MNNNRTTKYFKLFKGVRQGDPLSLYLFILALEVLAISVRNDENIKGIQINGKEIKMTIYADDTTMILKDKDAAQHMFKKLCKFKETSGLKINKEKCEGMWIGQNRLIEEKTFGIKWPETVKMLGVHIGTNELLTAEKNFENKLKNMKTKFSIWKSRDLSLLGRILIVKTFGTSQLLYLSNVLHIPDWVVTEAEKIIYDFVWKGQQYKVKKKVVIQDYEQGGYKLSDIISMFKVQMLKWISKYFNFRRIILETDNGRNYWNKKLKYFP